MFQVPGSVKFEKITFGDPPRQPLAAKPLMGPRGYKCGAEPPNFGFFAKIH